MLWWPSKVADWTNRPSVKHSSLVLSSSCQTHTHSILILPNTNTLDPHQIQAIWCSMFDGVLMETEIITLMCKNILSELWLWWGLGRDMYVSHIQKPLVLWQENVFWHCVNNIRSHLIFLFYLRFWSYGEHFKNSSTGFSIWTDVGILISTPPTQQTRLSILRTFRISFGWDELPSKNLTKCRPCVAFAKCKKFQWKTGKTKRKPILLEIGFRRGALVVVTV